MENLNLSLGLTLGIIAGFFLGSFALPLKRIKSWNWENTWIIYTTWATVILPLAAALFVIPDLFSLYMSVPARVILLVFLFGAGWGIANVGFGLGVSMVGLALGTAVILGMNNALGAILPILFFSPHEILTPMGRLLTTGVLIMIIGIVICSVAGSRREKARQSVTINEKSNFLKGLIICLMAGVCGAMFNFALIAGKPIEQQAIATGVDPLNAPYATWCISLFGGFIITLIYCGYLFLKNYSGKKFFMKLSGINWVYTFFMGIMWFGGVALYGMAVSKLGKSGASIGWPIIQSMAVASGNVWGIITGEWRGTGRKPLRLMIAGLLFLFIGIVIVGFSGTL